MEAINKSVPQQVALNNKNWKIRTETGFVDFEGVAVMGVKTVYELSFDDDTTVGATAAHFFFTPDGRDIAVGEMDIGIELLGSPHNKRVVGIKCVGEQEVFDVINTETHTFFVSGLLSHNCQFISNDPLLVDTLVLANLTEEVEKIKPVGMLEDIKFYKQPQAGVTYLIGMDVATGSGSDFTTLEVFEFPSLEQFAEFRSNSTSSVTCYNILKKIIRVLEKADATVYYSVENNGVGEAIIALIEADEDPPETAEFISESGQKRLGMTTTGKSKIRSCMVLKEMIERRQIDIKSRLLVEELKQYVRTGGSYAAKPGRTDDLISAVLVMIRILNELSSFDQTAYDKLYSHAFMDNQAGGYDINEYDDSPHSPDFVI